MAIQTAYGWILDVSYNHSTDYINLIIKLQDNKVINFKQRLKEYTFYIHPKSQFASEDLYHQLSRNDQVIKKIFWDEKYVDLADRNRTRLIGISMADIYSKDFQILIKKLEIDSRVPLIVQHRIICNS